LWIRILALHYPDFANIFYFASAHAVHLAVVDVLYKKPASSAFDNEDVEYFPPDEEEDDEETQADENFVLEKDPWDVVLADLTSTYKSIIGTVRSVVKYFK
jgi:hypothetical protein